MSLSSIRSAKAPGKGRRVSLAGTPGVVSEPVYRQLGRLCRERLSAGKARPGDRFPSERELASEFGVSRATANKVLSNLAAEGLLERRPGIGMFVSGGKSLHASLREMESFTGHVRAAGMEPETRVLDFQRLDAAEAPVEVRDGLEAADGEDLLFAERLRLADGEPVILELRWIRASAVPGLRRSQLAGSFYSLLEKKFGIALAGERHRIAARNLSAEEAEKLRVKPGSAALAVGGTGYAAGGDRPLWFQILLYRGDRYYLENSVRQENRAGSTEWKLTHAENGGQTRIERAS